MTALTGNTARLRMKIENGMVMETKVKTSAKVYEGSLLSVVESSGRLKATAAAAGETFVGVCLTNVTGNTGGTIKARYMIGHYERFACATALTKGYTGCIVAAADDDSVTTNSAAGTAGVRVIIGRLVQKVSANVAWVWIVGQMDKASP